MKETNSEMFQLDLSSLSPEQAVEHAIEQAADIGASDVNFASDEGAGHITVRHLGIVRPLAEVEAEQGKRMIARIKALAGMDIAEKRRPQDGRWIHICNDGRKIDLRINSIPTLFGEDLSLRLLVRESRMYSLKELGMIRSEYNQFLAMLNSPSGLILVSGPTGAGKTTTLYAGIHHLNDGTRKINTIEDPIEFSVKGVRQSQVNLKHGVDFPDLLRSVLRQAPDVILVGEIRDAITAQTAVRAANSGHLVFATLHAPVAAGAIQSMLALGVHPHFLASSLLGVIAQRLVRTLDPETKVPFDITESPHTFDEVRPWLQNGEGEVIYGHGPSTPQAPDGYSGRTAIFEVLTVSRAIRALISEDASSQEIEQKAIDEGMLEFRRGALLRVAQGTTSTEEILRAVPTEYLGVD